MKPEFNDAYRNLFYEYSDSEYYEDYIRRRFPFGRNVAILVREIKSRIIDEDEKNSNNTLRWDARYFLLVNFHQMIVTPLAFSDYTNGGSYLETERGNILKDVATVIQRAKEENKETPISGHALLNTINLSWSELNTTKLQIWGDDERLV